MIRKISKSENMNQIYEIIINSYVDARDNKNGNTFGCYIKIKYDKSNPLGKLGFGFKKLVKKYDSQLEDEILDEIVFELLCYSYKLLLLSDKGNKFFRLNGLERTNEDIVMILENEILKRALFNYLYTAGKFRLKKMIASGEFAQIDSKKYNHAERYEDKELYIEILHEKEKTGLKYNNISTTDEDGNFILENLVDGNSLDSKESQSFIKHIINICPKILTNKQLDYMYNENNYNKQQRYSFRQGIKKRIEKYIDSVDFIYMRNGKYVFDNNLYNKAKFKNKIELAKDNKEILNIIYMISIEDDNLMDWISDKIIEKLDYTYYQPLFIWIRDKKMPDTYWMANKLSKILDTLNQ